MPQRLPGKLEQRGDDGSHLQQPFELGAFGVAPPVQRLREHGRDAAARRRVPHERRFGHHRRAGKGILDPGVQGCQIRLGLRSGRHAQHVRQPRTSILREHLLQRRLLDRRPEDPHPALLHGRFGQKGHMGLPPLGLHRHQERIAIEQSAEQQLYQAAVPDDALCRDAAQLRRSAQRVRSGKSGHRKVPQPDPRTRRPRARAVGPLAGAHA